MNKITRNPIRRLGYDFVPPEYLPPDANEYHLREAQHPPGLEYRGLTASEIEVLVRNENTADNWASIFVADDFSPERVRRCQFFGLNRIGALEDCYLEFHDLRLPVGLYNSTIVSCDIGSNVALDNVCYIAHYILADEVILINVNEMLTTNHAKFGNGIVKEGEPEDVRVWLTLANEAGGREVAPFDGLLPADAWLWARSRDDAPLLDRLRTLTDARFDHRRGYYGEVGPRTIIKDCRILKDVKIGSDAYIKGANKLKNLTINSSAEESSQIGEGVELVNGIVGPGCRVFYGVKAVRFVMGPNSSLKYGARLINSFLGDNSTISCCEVLNSLIFPGHEQHHNNSFLCAAIVMGQSNVAAGVTAGSNHNSRAPDGEILAGRGFWPGLCTSLKHNSRFASFTLLAKGVYPAELDIRLPFSLVSNDEANGVLLVMPAYWWLHNMYALARNAWKYGARDSRVHKDQAIEFDYLAPDTVEEIFAALALLETWTGQAALRQDGQTPDGVDGQEVRARGSALLRGEPDEIADLDVLANGIENSRRPVRILKPHAAYASYREMVEYYCGQTLVAHMQAHDLRGLDALRRQLGDTRRVPWTNLGGQLARVSDVAELKRWIRDGELDSWDAIHTVYQDLWSRYPTERARHALASLYDITETPADRFDQTAWHAALDRAVTIRRQIAERVRASREKDYTSPFRQMTYESQAEMDAVLGMLDDNAFIRQTRDEAEQFAEVVAELQT
ncbi:MAG: DUF4954 family protein [Phycisphaerae bacterium]|nr:DUF4954 family protein [Phycisphaerae bacterium]